MEGFIKLYRQLTEWEWYKDGNTMRVFIHLLLTANHKPSRWRGIFIDRWQVISGRKVLASELNLTENEVRTAIWHLKTTNEITTETTSEFTLFSLTNYETYQSYITTETTNEPPTNHQRTTTNKNDNNNKNEKNIKKSTRAKKNKTDPEKTEVEKLVYLTPEEFENVKAIYGNLYKNALLKLSSQKESKGTVYKSDYATLHRWGWVYDYMIEKYPTLKNKALSEEKKEENKKIEKEKIENQKKLEKDYQESKKFYEKLPAVTKQKIIDRAEYELKSFTDEMRNKAGPRWKDIYGAKVRNIVDKYRETKVIEPIPKEKPDEETL